MPAVEPSEAVLPAGLAPAGTTELGIDIIRVGPDPRRARQVRAALLEAGADRIGTALRPRPARDDGRPVGGQGGGLEGPRPRRPGDRLA